jgi:hypothetical protein
MRKTLTIQIICNSCNTFAESLLESDSTSYYKKKTPVILRF